MVEDVEQSGRAGQRVETGSSVSKERIAALIKTHYVGLHLLVSRSTRDPAIAADILNDAIATALEHLREQRISQPEQIAGYIYQVALNHLRNHRRKMDERIDKRVDATALDNVAGSAQADEAVDDTELARQVRQVIGELPTARDRLIVKRFYLDEDDKDAICRDLGLSPLHFDKVVFRARQRMKALLEKRGFKATDFFPVLCAI